MALLKKARIVDLIFILVFCTKNGKVLADFRNFPESNVLSKVPDIGFPSTYEESISYYQEYILFELGIANHLFGKYQVYFNRFIRFRTSEKL